MEDVKEPMNLLSEQEAAKCCGVSRITLLRARRVVESILKRVWYRPVMGFKA